MYICDTCASLVQGRDCLTCHNEQSRSSYMDLRDAGSRESAAELLAGASRSELRAFARRNDIPVRPHDVRVSAADIMGDILAGARAIDPDNVPVPVTAREVQHAAFRRAEARVLDAADRLDPADQSLTAQQLRETAESILDGPDIADHEAFIWGS